MVTLNDDDQKHKDTETVEVSDAESALGSEVASGSDDVDEVDDITKSMGIYEDSDSDSPEEVDIAREIEKNDEG